MPSVHIKEGKCDGDSETEATISPHRSLAPSLGHRCVWFSPQSVEKKIFLMCYDIKNSGNITFKS